jgi:hypothetical protein
MGPVRTESALSYSRLEGAIAKWKPGRIKTDPTTNFWTVYKKVADEHDTDIVSKYVGDLDTSLLFVSMFHLFRALFASTRSFFCVRRVYSRPSVPRSLSKSSRRSSQIPPI